MTTQDQACREAFEEWAQRQKPPFNIPDAFAAWNGCAAWHAKESPSLERIVKALEAKIFAEQDHGARCYNSAVKDCVNTIRAEWAKEPADRKVGSEGGSELSGSTDKTVGYAESNKAFAGSPNSPITAEWLDNQEARLHGAAMVDAETSRMLMREIRRLQGEVEGVDEEELIRALDKMIDDNYSESECKLSLDPETIMEVIRPYLRTQPSEAVELLKRSLEVFPSCEMTEYESARVNAFVDDVNAFLLSRAALTPAVDIGKLVGQMEAFRVCNVHDYQRSSNKTLDRCIALVKRYGGRW